MKKLFVIAFSALAFAACSSNATTEEGKGKDSTAAATEQAAPAATPATETPAATPATETPAATTPATETPAATPAPAPAAH